MQVERSAGGVGVVEEVEVNPLKKGGSRERRLESSVPASLAPLSAAPPPQQRPPPSASLLADKYLILDPPEGCSLHTCIDVHTRQELVCRVSTRGQGPSFISPPFRKTDLLDVVSLLPYNSVLDPRPPIFSVSS
jgi:hypothetical protein